jgi:predicted RNase H-like nuclease
VTQHQRGRPGPVLPYDLLAGAVPVKNGWLVVRGKLVGISLNPEPGEVVPHFSDVLDHIPSYVITAVMAPIGLYKRWVEKGRRCDREARELVGWPHLGAISSPPGRLDLEAGERVVGDITTRRLRTAIAEVDEQMQPYRQRSVYSVHSELSFYQLNGDKPPVHSKQSAAGLEERIEMLTHRMQGVDRVLGTEIEGISQRHLIDGAVALWTARRIVAKAAQRTPEDPEWDDEGLRMEWMR